MFVDAGGSPPLRGCFFHGDGRWAPGGGGEVVPLEEEETSTALEMVLAKMKEGGG